MFSLSDSLIADLLSETLPSYQVTSKSDSNLGYGFLFYSLSRLVRPRTVVVVGSKAGFSVICFALGLKDNHGSLIKSVECYDTVLMDERHSGLVYFVDPSYSIDRGDSNCWYGIGFWDDADKVRAHWIKFGVADCVMHHKMTSKEFCGAGHCPQEIDLLYIDGDHSYEGILQDFTQFRPYLKGDALILAHDIDPGLRGEFPETGGYEAICDLDPSVFEVCRLPVYPGMAIVRKKR